MANTAFAYAVYALALYAGAPYPLASLVSLACGIVFGFLTQGRLVFRNARNGLFGRYLLVWALIYGVNVGQIALFMGLGQDAFVAGALAVPLNVLLGYVLQRYFVFAARGPD